MFFPRDKVLFLTVDVQPAYLDLDKPVLREQLKRMTLMRQRMADNAVACWQIGDWWPETPAVLPTTNAYRPLLPAMSKERLFGKWFTRAPKLNDAFAEAVRHFQPGAIVAQGCYLELCVLETLQHALNIDHEANGKSVGLLLTDCGRARWEPHENRPVDWQDVQPIKRLQLNLSAAGLIVDVPDRSHCMAMQAAPEDERNFG